MIARSLGTEYARSFFLLESLKGTETARTAIMQTLDSHA
jgi:hypothetical protein